MYRNDIMKIYNLGKDNPAKLGWYALLLLVLCSCVTTQQDLLIMNDQIVAMNSRINKLEESMGTKLSTELDSKLDSIRDSQAEGGADIDKIKGQIQDLSGRVEDNRRLVKHTIERDTKEQDTVKARLSELTDRVTELELRHKQVQEYLGLKESGDLGKQYVKEGPVEPKEPPKKSPTLEERPALSENQLYETTLVTYKQGQYDQALVGFKSFTEKYPQSELADNAQFWVGECYMSLKQYEQAILAYQEVIKKYPKGNKVPNAMLRQAFAFHEINDKISSKLLLKKIIKKYPDSSEAKIASAKLKTLN
jgi:tol-pal system protein YbgF